MRMFFHTPTHPHTLPSSRWALRRLAIGELARRVIRIVVCAATFCAASFAPHVSAASSDSLIRDAQGRVRYIVDLFEDESGKPSRFAGAAEKIAWHKANSARLIEDTTKLPGIDVVTSTSLVGTSFTAYLYEKQAEQLTKDKRVQRLTPDARLTSSGNLWSDTANGAEILSWARQAMGIVTTASTGSAIVYVIDTGVEQHRDLPGLVTRIAVFPGMSPTGCYPHATHVAGIIGAGNNGMDVVGMNPGVRMVSIAIGDTAGN